MRKPSYLSAGFALLAGIATLATAACRRESGNASVPGASPATASAPAASATTATTATTASAATTAAPAPSPEEAAAAAEIRKAIADFSLTEPILVKILAIEGELKDFWADPVQARMIRGERSLPKILAAIDAAPRLKSTIAKHGLSPREYILGTFSMIAGYIWEKASAQQPASVTGKTPPASATTLATVKKHIAEITGLLSGPPRPTAKPHPGQEED